MAQQECLYFDNMDKIGTKHKHIFTVVFLYYYSFSVKI